MNEEKPAIDLERLDCLLKSHPGITDLQTFRERGERFERGRTFRVRGFFYQIQWWKNCSYLHVGDVTIPFTDLQIHGNWPNGFRLNLHFYDGGHTCAILPLESYTAPLDSRGQLGPMAYLN